MELNKLLTNLQVVNTAVEQLQVSIFITDKKKRIVFVNEYLLENTGFSKEDLIGKKPEILIADKVLYQKVTKQLFRGESWQGEYQAVRKDGSLFWERATISPIKNDQNETTHYVALKQDISREKERELKVQRRERILNDVQKISQTGGWEYDRKEDKFFWTQQLYDIHGFEEPYPANHMVASLKCYNEDDRLIIEKKFNECREKGTPYDIIVPFTDVKGNKKWIRTKTHAIKNENDKVVKVVGSVKDVTEEEEALIALQESESKFKNVVRAFDDIVFTTDLDGRHTEIFGHLSEDKDFTTFIKGKTAYEVYGKDKGKKHMDAIERVKREDSVVYDWEAEDETGEVYYYQTKLTQLTNSNGELYGILGVGRNMTREVTSRKKAEELQERLDYALEGTRAGFWDWNIKTGETIFSERWAEMLGYTLEELEPTTIETWVNLLHPTDEEHTKYVLDQHLAGESDIYEVKFRMRHKDGHWVWIWDRGAVFERDEDGSPIRMVGTHLDITEQVQAEEKLVHSEKRYRDLFEKPTDPTLIEKDKRIFDCNKAAYQLFGYERKDELIGKKVTEISPGLQFDEEKTSTRLSEVIQKAIENGSHKFEWEILHKDGRKIPTDIVLTNIHDENWEYMRHVLLRDISDRKEAEKKIIASNEERGALLSEIHHRVKNNLAIISGLLQLQIFNSDSKREIEILNKSVNRIKSIALIHEQLYQSKNFSNIELHDNIRKQAENLLTMFKSDIAVDVELDLDLKPVKIHINQALPLGLLINEILTNSLKHAFNGEKSGTISISLTEKESELVELCIKDNGRGITENERENWQSSLGTTLIDTFLKQLEADVVFENNSGTSYQITFQKKVNSGSVTNHLIQ